MNVDVLLSCFHALTYNLPMSAVMKFLSEHFWTFSYDFKIKEKIEDDGSFASQHIYVWKGQETNFFAFNTWMNGVLVLTCKWVFVFPD